MERLKRDVLSKKTDWMTLSCGISDVWHGNNGIPLAPYNEFLRQLDEKGALVQARQDLLLPAILPMKK